jgi:hypothetical protein
MINDDDFVYPSPMRWGWFSPSSVAAHTVTTGPPKASNTMRNVGCGDERNKTNKTDFPILYR